MGHRDAPVVFVANDGEVFQVADLEWDGKNGFWALMEDNGE